MSDDRNQLPAPPGKGLLGWLGRQVGHVRKAIRTDVRPTVARRTRVQEAPHPTDERLKLRRTTVDEIVRDDRS